MVKVKVKLMVMVMVMVMVGDGDGDADADGDGGDGNDDDGDKDKGDDKRERPIACLSPIYSRRRHKHLPQSSVRKSNRLRPSARAPASAKC